MLEWIAANAANIIISAALLVIVALAVISIVRRKKSGKGSCGCGCGNCPQSGYCNSAQKKL